MLAPNKTDKQKDYIKESQLLHNALTLCRSLITQHEKQEVALMDAIRVLLLRFTQNHGPVTKQEINERIAALIEQSIQSTGVINLFETKREFSLFDEGFIEELRKMKEKNLAVQLLEKLVKERIRQYERTNIVQSQKFSELMNQALSNYLKGMLTNEEVIQELLKLASQIKETEQQGNDLGLTDEEKAFYDALTRPRAVKDFYTNDQLVEMTKELTDMLRKNRTIDWNRREAERANMRRLVRRLLKRYKYPPEETDDAMTIVLKQCERWAENDDNLVINVTIENHYHGNIDQLTINSDK